jgi:integrase
VEADVLRVRDRATRTLAPQTVVAVLGLLRMILGAAVHASLLTRNVAAKVRSPDVPDRPELLVDLPAARRLFDTFHAHPLGALFVVALESGLREGELFGLRRSDIDWSGLSDRLSNGA